MDFLPHLGKAGATGSSELIFCVALASSGMVLEVGVHILAKSRGTSPVGIPRSPTVVPDWYGKVESLSWYAARCTPAAQPYRTQYYLEVCVA